ncbi:hypothetical protein ON010_g1490 [Phytophthora cinnamomi]|nr:hypothetical protein ON010_g1490 [Phytophthora cinnamomi]
MSASATTGVPAVPRRAEGNVALGLFSKIAAARKENLSSFTKAATGDLGPPGRSLEKRPGAAGTSHFPELSDPSMHLARNPALRTPVISERKPHARSHSQNLRWTKQSVPEDPLGAVGSSATLSGSIYNAPGANRAVSAASQRSIPVGLATPASRRRHLLPPQQQLYQQRRSTSSTSRESLKDEQEISIKETPIRPATASEILDTRYSAYQGNVRGYVRRPPEALSSSLDSSDSALWHRHGELPHTLQASAVDGRMSGADSRLHSNKSQAGVIVSGDPGSGEHPVSAPNQEVHFAVTAEIPGVPIVYRNQKTKASNPERLNLDRRNLPVIPLLEGEQILRLLNLQNNVIRRIENLLGLPNLIFLDLYNNRIEPLSDADRREALLHVNSPSKGDDDAETAARAHAIMCVKSAWERRTEVAHSPTNAKESRELALLSSWGLPGKEEVVSHVGYEERDVSPTSREELTVCNNNNGFSEVEVYGDYRVLVIYGNALEVIELTKAHSLVNAVSFRYIGMSKIMSAVASATSSNLKLFSRLRRMIFAHNDLQSFDELLWLSGMGSKAEEVFISNNPVCTKTLLKRYIGARISNTLRLNGEEITPNDRHMGKQLFPKPIVPRTRSVVDPSELSSLLPSKARVKEVKEMKPSRCASALHGNPVSSAATDIFDTASDIDKKTAALDQAWKGMLLSIVKVRPTSQLELAALLVLTPRATDQETLQDIERRDSFMSGCLDNL